MGYDRALKAIHLEETDRIPHWELISNPAFEQAVTGIDPYQSPQTARLRLIELLDLDVSSIPLLDEPAKSRAVADGTSWVDDEGEKVVRWGAGSTWRWSWGKGFTDTQQVLDFEPSTIEYDPYVGDLTLSVEELAERLNEDHRKAQALAGKRSLVPGGFYKTLFMWPLMTFGWSLFLKANAEAPGRLRKLIDKFALVSEKVMEAWALADVKLFTSHDDICTRNGPIFNRQWYREVIYPWYKRFWARLKDRGIKVVFISDGNVDMVADDIFDAGADGIFVEVYTNLGKLVEKYGESKIFYGGIDTRVLTLGGKAEIVAEVERCTRLTKRCPGYFYCASGHIPYNVPVENAKVYFEACRKLGERS